MSTSVPYLDVSTVEEACVIGFTRTDMTDAAYIQQVGDELYRIVRSRERPKVILDFQIVQRLSSATLGMIVALQRVLEKQDGQLRVANMDDSLHDIFKLTKLHTVLTICKSTSEAIKSFD